MKRFLVVVILLIVLSFIPIVPYDFKLDNGATEIRHKSIATIAYKHYQKGK